MKWIRQFPAILGVVVLLIAWQLVATSINYPAIFPTIPELFRQVWQLFSANDFILAIFITLGRGIAGFAIAFILTFACASISVFFPFWKNFLHPFVVVTRSIPVISFVLLALLWFSTEKIPVFIALLTMFPILYQGILTGFEQTDKKWIEMARVFGKPAWTRFFRIYIPASKPAIYDGVSTALGFGWRAIIIGEVLAQPLHGIGTSMKEAQAFINVSELIAWTVCAIVIIYLMDMLVKRIRKIKVNRWLPMPESFEMKNENRPTGTKAIKIQNLNKRFNEVPVFGSMNYEFEPMAITCLKGHSGKGKTTLLRLVAGIEKPDSGRIEIPEALYMSYAFQDFRLLPWLTVSENIQFVIRKDKASNKQYISNLVHFLLENMELLEHGHKFPHQLSGGQQQRVSLARALAAQSDILLLDEPLTGLDEGLKTRILEFLSRWFLIYKPTVIWATHQEIYFKEIVVEELKV
ncbi:MAG TPA: ATP-binding cassette domain-containing protein [Paludibacter sp.]|nr:ATP-binding cassette domain-containing protein [Paludibacter sp.]